VSDRHATERPTCGIPITGPQDKILGIDVVIPAGWRARWDDRLSAPREPSS
jgi:hypothetical protein